MKHKRKSKKLRLARKQKHLPVRLVNGAEIVMQHPQLRLIVEWLREGTSAAAVARYMEQSGMISQSHRTYTDYLLAFKRVHPELLQDGSPVSLDDIVNANKPPVSVEKELHRMYRLQKMRLAVAAQQELRRGRLNKDGHRELAVAHDYLQTMAKMDSVVDNSGVDTGLDPQKLRRLSKEVQEKLIAIKTDEIKRERINTLTLQFIEKITSNRMNQIPKTGEGH